MPKWNITATGEVSYHAEVEADTREEAEKIFWRDEDTSFPYINENWEQSGELEIGEDGIEEVGY